MVSSYTAPALQPWTVTDALIDPFTTGLSGSVEPSPVMVSSTVYAVFLAGVSITTG